MTILITAVLGFVRLVIFTSKIALILFIVSLIPLPAEFEQLFNVIQSIIAKSGYVVRLFALDIAFGLVVFVYSTKFVFKLMFGVVK